MGLLVSKLERVAPRHQCQAGKRSVLPRRRWKQRRGVCGNAGTTAQNFLAFTSARHSLALAPDSWATICHQKGWSSSPTKAISVPSGQSWRRKHCLFALQPRQSKAANAKERHCGHLLPPITQVSNKDGNLMRFG